MASSVISQVNDYALSPLAAGSRQFSVCLREGVPLEVSSRNLLATASYTNRGVATVLTILGYAEPVVQTLGGFSVVRATSRSSGNSSFIPLGTGLLTYNGDYSSGSTSITINTSGSGETVVLEYDPASFGGTSIPVCRGDLLTFASVGSIGDQIAPAAAVEAAHVIVLETTAAPSTWIGARAGSPEDLVFAAAHNGAVNDAVLSINGVHRIIMSGVIPPFLYLQASTAAANITKWNFYRFSELPATGPPPRNQYPTTKDYLFTSAAVSGDIARVPYASLAKTTPQGNLRTVSILFNAEEVFSADDTRYGGVASR